VPNHEFGLCLTHDVDRPYKSLAQSVYYALCDRSPHHVRDVLGGRNPYWQFESVMELESRLGVRSSFYFLTEPHLFSEPPRAWLASRTWIEHLGRYDVREPALASVARDLDEGGWEVGIHGSRAAEGDRDRLRLEKKRLQNVLGRAVLGGRQHYLSLSVPETWRHYRAVGLRYDASLGSRTDPGFQHGYDVLRPFDDEFAVFPLTLMETMLPDPAERWEAARDILESLLQEARANDAVMTVLWHPRYFAERDFPGYGRAYRWLVERALELDAWVGSPGEYYDAFLRGDADAMSGRVELLEGYAADNKARSGGT
jgi:hypothetical protein